MPIDDELLQILACPKCRGDLTPVRGKDFAEGLVCPACKLVYPVEDDIPVLLIEEAVPQNEWK